MIEIRTTLIALAAASLLAGVTAAPAATLTTTQRLNRLENGNTNFQHTKPRSLHKSYVKSSTRAACNFPAMEFPFTVANVNPAVTDQFATVDVTWSGSLEKLTIAMRRKGSEGIMPDCNQEYDLTGLSSAQLKLFCEFSVQPAAIVTVQLFATASDGTCQITQADVSLKQVNAEKLEPTESE